MNSRALAGVAYGNGQFVAVFPGLHAGVPLPWVFTSPDGVNWTQLPGPPDVSTVTFGNGVFVGGGSYWGAPGYILNGVLYSSSDGTNWTQRGSVGGASFSGVAYGSGQFVALAGPSVYTSPDGTNWVAHAVLAEASALAYGNGQFIGVNGANVVRSGLIGKLGASLSPAGQFLGTISGLAGQNYAIQDSSNLRDWIDLTNVTITNGLARFTDSAAANLGRRFYKATTVGQ